MNRGGGWLMLYLLWSLLVPVVKTVKKRDPCLVGGIGAAAGRAEFIRLPKPRAV